ncbi:MAG TPA: ABC transporter ATP-binding protein [Acidimicrobiales bacterium]|nr:ABC transporter ATP-binding protein [Acidimicrobiales bacterium]
MNEVELRGVTKTFGAVRALRGVDLDVPAGSLVSVLGPSGCGKTTLLRVIAGFERQDTGTVRIAGEVQTGPPETRRVGIVPQEGALFPHLDVAGNVGFGLRRDGRARRVAEMLDLVGLAGLERRKPHELSGGQQQRVALARALAPEPAVVLLDEPFTALDAGLRSGLRTQVLELLRATGTTAVLVTHDQTEALVMADAVAVMREGRIVQAGTPDEIYLRPADLETGRFVGDAVILPGYGDGATVTTVIGPVAAPGVQGDVTVLLRPEQLVRDEYAATRAKVRSLAFHGHDALVTIEIAGVAVVARWQGGTLPQPGDEVGIRVDGEAVTFSGAPAG